MADAAPNTPPALPASPTSVAISLCGFLTALLTFLAARAYNRGPLAARLGPGVVDVLGDHLDPFSVTLACLAALALPIVVLERLLLRTHLRPSTGLDRDRPPAYDLVRVGTKVLGLVGTLGLLAGFYGLAPEYEGAFYNPWYRLLGLLGPWLLLASPFYLAWTDARQTNPRDGYWQAGRLLLGHAEDVDGAVIGQHVLGWMVKAFFLPLMFSYLVGDIKDLLAFDPGSVAGAAAGHVPAMRRAYDFGWDALFTVDLIYTTAGYLLTLRLLDGHLRSTEPTFLGWGVALVCYQPFWKSIWSNYLNYDDGLAWGGWLSRSPTLFAAWGVTILTLVAIYVWATITFSLRFSNLTHRGVLTNGPYRFTKHPAYVAKNLSWWLASIPFIPPAWTADGAATALRCCVALACVNGIYLMRARTEERHLSRDPDYVAYATAMEQRSVFRWVGRLIPPLRYARGGLFAPWRGDAA